MELHLNSSRDSHRLWLDVVSDVDIYEAEILGHRLDGAKDGWNGHFGLLPREGAVLRFETEVDGPLVTAMREESTHLPELPGFRRTAGTYPLPHPTGG